MRGTSKPSSNGVSPVVGEDDGEEAAHLPTPLSQREVRRARAKLAYEMLELVQADLGPGAPHAVRKAVSRALNVTYLLRALFESGTFRDMQ